MTGIHYLFRTALPTGVLLLAGWALLGERGVGLAALLAAAALLAWNWRLRRAIGAADKRLAAFRSEDAPSASLEEGIETIEARLRHRLLSSHPVTGLPMREALVARMIAAQGGLLGVLRFADFDRLTAFDPQLGERLLTTSIARLSRMLPASRFAAQVDRGHVGLWFEGVEEDEVRAELDAIGYALGEEIDDDGYRIRPQVTMRLARFDMADGLDAGTFVSRTVASFTLPSAPAGEIVDKSAPVDHAAIARDRYALEQDLHQAIVRHELRLVFQPLIDASRGRVSGAEALIRWQHADRGAVEPSRFVPIMEATGLVNEIGMWALNAAVREAQAWRQAGLNGLRVAVNLSALQLERSDLPLLIQRILMPHEIGANALELELTESVATTDAEHCRTIFGELRAMGVRLAVDDFGTGYSGFSSLRQLAFDKIKIDREFVTDVDRRRDSQAICQSIIALGRGLGICVLAEGVERREEYEWLRRHGCDHFQGFYFSRPLEAQAFRAFVGDAATLNSLLRLSSPFQSLPERLSA